MSRTVLFLLPLIALVGCKKDDGGGDDTDADDTDVEDTEVPALSVTVTPASPLAGEALRCEVDAVDAGDATFSWTVDGVDAGIASADVPEGTTDAYETWTCHVDGGTAGVGEASVEIGETCSALHLDSSSDIGATKVGDGLDMQTSSFTVEAWFFEDEEVVAGISEWPLVARTQLANPYDREFYDYGLMRGTNGDLRFVTGGVIDDCTVLVTPFVTRGCWHHVAATFDVATGFKAIFVDGAMRASCATVERGYDADGPVVVGGLVQSGTRLTPFPGWIDEVRISTGVRYTAPFEPELYLSPDADTQLLLHMNVTEPWFKDPSVTSVPDASGNDRPLLLGGDATSVSSDRSACDVPDQMCPVP